MDFSVLKSSLYFWLLLYIQANLIVGKVYLDASSSRSEDEVFVSSGNTSTHMTKEWNSSRSLWPIDPSDQPHRYFDPNGPVKVLLISIVITFGMLLCLRCHLENRSGNASSTPTEMNFGDQMEAPHRYERYHVGSGPSYDPVPCSALPAPPGQNVGSVPQEVGPGYSHQGYRTGSPQGHYEETARSSQLSQGYELNTPMGAGRVTEAPPDYEPPGVVGRALPDYCYHGDTIGLTSGIDGVSSRSVDPADDQREPLQGTGFNPGTGTNYPSMPPPNLDIAMDSRSPTWPVVAHGYPSMTRPPFSGQLMATGQPHSVPSNITSRTVPNDDELPSYEEAVFRSNMQY